MKSRSSRFQGTAFITASQEEMRITRPRQGEPVLTLKRSQTITFNPFLKSTYAILTLTRGNLQFVTPVTYLSSKSFSGCYFRNVIHITGAGTTVHIRPGGNDDFDSAPVVPQQLTVRKADQMITFNAIPDQVFAMMPLFYSTASSS
jgi:hypothetical protein